MKAMLYGLFAALAVVPGLALAGDQSPSDTRFNVTIKALPAALATQEAVIKAHIEVAARMWADLLDVKPCQTEIAFAIRDVVEGHPEELGYGKSRETVLRGQPTQAGKRIAEQGWASTLRTGRHAGRGGPDVEIELQTAYVLREFWWDPDPIARKAPVPPGKLDALSVLLHELGHAIAFNGWLDPRNGKTGDTLSAYDRWVLWNGRDFYFEGPHAVQVYGKPVLLGHTLNNYHHVGEERADVPEDLVLKNDLMTAYRFHWERRYYISPLDIAILKDCGIQTKK